MDTLPSSSSSRPRKALSRAALLLALLSSGAALAQPQSATQPAGQSTTGGILPLVSVGNTWPQAQESYNIVVTPANAGKPLGLEVYSPTTNLADYADFTASSKRGPNYFGDEIYSAQKTFETSFVLAGAGGTVVSRQYATNREHTWDSLFAGGLPAGTYTLKVTSRGNGKNAFALRVNAPFALETSDFSVNARSTTPEPLLAARLSIPAEWVGKTVSVINYDIDGPQEAESWLVLPGNVRANLTTSENGKSATNRFTITPQQVGEWQVFIRVLPTTKQYSNAIRYSFRIGDQPTQARVGGFETPKDALIANRLVVDVVDTQGNPIPGSSYVLVGENTVKPSLPQGYTPVSSSLIEGKGTVVSPTEVRFQPGNNRVRFVARRPSVLVDVVDPQGNPIPGATATAEGGVARPVLPQGYVPVSCTILEGRGNVVSPSEVRYQPGDTRIRCVARQPRLKVDVVDTEGRPIPGSDYTAQNGVASPELPGSYVPVSANLLEGRGTVGSPTEVRYQPNEDTTIRFVARLQRLAVDVVDTQGRPIPGANFTVQGNLVRPTLPQGWVPVSSTILEGQGTTPSPTEVQFQPGDTRIRFVARQPEGGLAVDAVAIFGDRRIPLSGIPFQVNGQTLNTPATIPLTPGDYPVTPTAIPDSTFVTPQPGRVVDGQTGRVTIEYRVLTSLSLSVAPDLLAACDVSQLSVVAKTNFPYRLPANVRVNLPSGWSTDYPLQLSGDFGGGQALRLKAPVRICRSDAAQAVLEPTGLTTSGQATVRAPGGANASRVVENGAQAALTKTVEATANGYAVSMVLTVNGTIDNLRIIDPLPQGTNPGVRSGVSVGGAATVGASTDGEAIVLGRVTTGTYRLSYTLFTDAPADRVVTAPELSW